MSRRRKVADVSKWREGQRRSPRISALDAFKAQQSRRVCATPKPKRHHHSRSQPKGPASRTRARKKRKLKPLEDVEAQSPQGGEEPNQEDHQGNNNQLFSVDQDIPKHEDDDATRLEQSFTTQSTSWMRRKRVLELILDILQRRDTYEIFAEPVDPDEVEDYYEIIKEPMDFGTMRAKLHEGMYSSLEQFEHDAFLISKNAMHFNSSSTIYFRQARAIHELAKKVFHALKMDPENFESEFSETRRKNGRMRPGEARRSLNYSTPKLPTNMRFNSLVTNESSKSMLCSSSGSINVRRGPKGNLECSASATYFNTRDYEMLSGMKDGRRASSSRADRRSTYIPWTSFLNKTKSATSTICDASKSLIHVNLEEFRYKESLMLFVKDLGPTVQMIAKRKLSLASLHSTNPGSKCGFEADKCENAITLGCVQKKHKNPDVVQDLGNGIHNLVRNVGYERRQCDLETREKEYKCVSICSGVTVGGSDENEIGGVGNNIYENRTSGGLELGFASFCGGRELKFSGKESWRMKMGKEKIEEMGEDENRGFIFDLPYLKTRLDEINKNCQELSLDKHHRDVALHL
ncbi:bromodomain-containing protein DDB_G0270170-like isoform X2 [Carica papaya]|uniref:bromodomain-containing protein DDB_G0270170-like isoform X2 n=1 Tax=Carica papaya TaxID=3649 RepID=UPI000B8CAD42|nr:bromodomain-containing protein DDB_G0270170-like isoform X2 [Carica papaya]